MATITVDKLAKKTGIPLIKLMGLMTDAGIRIVSGNQVLSAGEQEALKEHVMRKVFKVAAA